MSFMAHNHPHCGRGRVEELTDHDVEMIVKDSEERYGHISAVASIRTANTDSG